MGGRAERRLGVVPQAQRGLQAAQAAAGLLERVAVLGLEREHGDGRVRVVSGSPCGASASVVARTRLSPSPSDTSSDSITSPSTGVITTPSAQPS